MPRINCCGLLPRQAMSSLQEQRAILHLTHLPFAEWFERFGPPASSTYAEVNPYAQQEDNSDSETPAE
jgi:hypothetical protein